jgi:hypothetical protein
MLFILALLIFLMISSLVMASSQFDDQRNGPMIGGLGGVSMNVLDEENGYSGTDFGLHTDFRFGWAFDNDRFMLIVVWNAMNWFVVRSAETEEFILSGITGVGFSYYFKSTSPSLYVNAGIGLATVRSLDISPTSETGLRKDNGLGLMGGVGYEFRPHWSVELFTMYGFPGSGNYSVSSFAVSLSIIGIAY